MKHLLITASLLILLAKTYYGQYPNILDYYNTGGLGGYPNYGIGGYPDYGNYGGIFNPYGGDIQQDPKVYLNAFVKNAQSMVGSDEYTYAGKYAGRHKIGKKKDKCHVFVYDVITESGAKAPQKFPMFPFKSSPISAKIWQNQRSTIILLAGHFKRCTGRTAPGDIIAYKNHVGVVIDNRKTVMADPEANPRGLINATDWGFRKGQRPTCWRYA